MNKKGLAQGKLARLTDISLNTLTKIESGLTKRLAIQTIHKIAKALGTSLDKLAAMGECVLVEDGFLSIYFNYSRIAK